LQSPFTVNRFGMICDKGWRRCLSGSSRSFGNFSRPTFHRRHGPQNPEEDTLNEAYSQSQ